MSNQIFMLRVVRVASRSVVSIILLITIVPVSLLVALIVRLRNRLIVPSVKVGKLFIGINEIVSNITSISDVLLKKRAMRSSCLSGQSSLRGI